MTSKMRTKLREKEVRIVATFQVNLRNMALSIQIETKVTHSQRFC